MFLRATLAAFALALPLAMAPPATAQQKPEDELAGVVGALSTTLVDWRSIESVRAVRWAPLPPTMLQNCLPDGGCFTRAGVTTVGARQMSVLATGARTMVGNVYLRNTGAPFGEAAIVDGLRRAGLNPQLARCPVRAGGPVHNSKWWRVTRGQSVAHVSLTIACGAQRCEGIGVHGGPELPPLDPAELSRYSTQCNASGGGAPVASTRPHEEIARLIAAAIPRATEPVPMTWAALRQRFPAIQWAAALVPRDPALAYDNDPGTRYLIPTNEVRLATRLMNIQATGDVRSARMLRIEEGGMHPRGESVQLLNALRAAGYGVTLARCGRPYTESRHTYYRLAGPGARVSFMKIEERFEGPREQTSLRIYLDGALPAPLSGETAPGGACR
jgi:hypothetical protein